MNVDYQAMDWGTRGAASRRPAVSGDKGGWNLFITGWSGLDQSNPVGHVFLRGNGKQGDAGLADRAEDRGAAAAMDRRRNRRRQKKLAVEIQQQALSDLPYVPLGQYFSPTAYRKDVADILDGFVIFWNVRKA